MIVVVDGSIDGCTVRMDIGTKGGAYCTVNVYFSLKLYQCYSCRGKRRRDLIDVTAPW